MAAGGANTRNRTANAVTVEESARPPAAPTAAEPAPAAFGFVYPEDAAAEEPRELEEPESQMAAEENAESVVSEQSHKDDNREERRRDGCN